MNLFFLHFFLFCEICFSTYCNNLFFFSQVLHSQRLREKHLEPWIISEKEGKILACHCTCMAGLGETCTHVSALLFAIEAMVKLRDSRTVTQEKAYWLLPNCMKNVEYKECKDIDFSSAKALKKKLDQSISESSSGASNSREHVISKKSITAKTPSPTDNELNDFFKSLDIGGAKPGIFSLVEPYANSFIPEAKSAAFPVLLTDLRDEGASSLNFAELLKLCQEVKKKIIVTQQQAKSVEKATQDQANSKLWFRFRAGRITASKMKSICCTDPALPSQSLIKSICYPESQSF